MLRLAQQKEREGAGIPGGCSPPAEGAGPRRDGMAPPLAQPPLAQPPPPGKEEQRAKGEERVQR